MHLYLTSPVSDLEHENGVCAQAAEQTCADSALALTLLSRQGRHGKLVEMMNFHYYVGGVNIQKVVLYRIFL